jgi:succinylglutamate desuccinylase
MKLFYQFTQLPDGFLTTSSTDLHQILPGPSLIHLPGKKNPPLFISTLLHGNETSGLRALQTYLQQYINQPLPRALILFIGNIRAAQHNLRRLADQADYNRIWFDEGDTPQHKMAFEILALMRQQPLFASIDIHNNTGKNPHYACINQLTPKCIYLASLYESRIVYFTRPKEVLCRAFSQFCPAITIECGLSSEIDNIQQLVKLLNQVASLDTIPDSQDYQQLTLYHSNVKVNLPNDVTISFDQGDTEADICLRADVESLNFQTLPHDTLLGWRNNPHKNLLLTDEHGKDVSRDYLNIVGNEIYTNKAVVPAMLTRDLSNIRLDCLGYFMEDIDSQRLQTLVD